MASESAASAAASSAPSISLRRVSPTSLLSHTHTQTHTPVDETTRAQAAAILDEVRSKGEAGLLEVAIRFGDIKAGEPYVLNRDALERAFHALPKEQQALLERVAGRIRAFATAQRLSISDVTVSVPGGMAGHTVAPVDTAGCYAPGGRYPLPSSVLMTAITARVAGVPKVWVASPRPAPITLGAAFVAGADALLAVGGAQAIAAMAYGIGQVPACDVIVGPGNRWVTAAKSIVAGHCAIDMLAGPSECLVLADESADATVRDQLHCDFYVRERHERHLAFVQLIAADLLAQAEHDTDAMPILVTTSAALAEKVDDELSVQLAKLPTKATAEVSVSKGYTVICDSIDQAVAVCDKLAPEHLEVQVKDADTVWKRLSNYGGMFVGANTAEVFGDYGAGPNHVLPTSGTARYTGGLSVFTFLRIRTWLRSDADAVDKEGLREVIEDSAHLARLEGLAGHEAAAVARRKAL